MEYSRRGACGTSSSETRIVGARVIICAFSLFIQTFLIHDEGSSHVTISISTHRGCGMPSLRIEACAGIDDERPDAGKLHASKSPLRDQHLTVDVGTTSVLLERPNIKGDSLALMKRC